jgi:hypothetical protein
MFALAADMSLRIVAAAAAVGLVLVVLRVRSGAARHAAWSAVLLAMLTMPGLMAIVPPVEVPVPSTLALDPAPGRRAGVGGRLPREVGGTQPAGARPPAEGRRTDPRGGDADVLPIRRSAPLETTTRLTSIASERSE